MADQSPKDLSALIKERAALVAQLESGRAPEESPEHDAVIDQLEEIDRAIVATPAESAADLLIKLDRLADRLQLAPGVTLHDSVEANLMRTILEDVRGLSLKEES